MTAPDDTNCDGMMCVVHCANKLKCSGHDSAGFGKQKFMPPLFRSGCCGRISMLDSEAGQPEVSGPAVQFFPGFPPFVAFRPCKMRQSQGAKSSATMHGEEVLLHCLSRWCPGSGSCIRARRPNNWCQKRFPRWLVWPAQAILLGLLVMN